MIRISPRQATFGGILCLIFGGITTGAVAWGCAYRAVRVLGSYAEPSPGVIDELKLPRESEDANGAVYPLFARAHYALGYRSLEAWYGADDLIYDNEGIAALRVESGFPTRALYGSYDDIPRESTGFLRFNGTIPSVIPVIPIWPGFLIDTLFYAAIWFGVVFGFTSAKRFIRAKRGRCPRCGYDLRGALKKGCPEGGWTWETSSRRDDGM